MHTPGLNHHFYYSLVLYTALLTVIYTESIFQYAKNTNVKVQRRDSATSDPLDEENVVNAIVLTISYATSQ